MKIYNIKTEKKPGCTELSASVLYNSEKNPRVFWFRFPPDLADLYLSADPFLAGTLAEAMWKNEDIEIDGEISRRLFNSLETIMDYLAMKIKEFSHIKVTTKKIRGSSSQGNLHGCFFSGGVDSSYTFLKNKDDIDALIVIRGQDFDLDPKNDAVWEKMVAHAWKIAAEYGKKVVTVVTNLHFYSKNDDTAAMRFWLEAVNGSHLAAAGLALSALFNKIYIASGVTFIDLESFGSHPLLDPLWSTEKLEFIHDGCEANRPEKIKRQVAKSKIILKGLRVCLEDYKHKYNCCRCQKCLKTMACLRLAGVLQECESFPEPLNLKLIPKLWLYERQIVNTWKEVLEEAQKKKDTELIRAIEKAFIRTKIKNIIYPPIFNTKNPFLIMLKRPVKFLAENYRAYKQQS